MRRGVALGTLVAVVLAAASGFGAAIKAPDLSANMVMLKGDEVFQTMKFYMSGEKTRMEMTTMGGMVTIVRRDKMVTWTLFTQTKKYTERALDPKQAMIGVTAELPGTTKKEELGTEDVQGYACKKIRITFQPPGAKLPMTATMWLSEKLGIPIRSETMGMITEYREIKLGPQVPELFEVPEGFEKSDSPFPIPIPKLKVPVPKAKDVE